MSNWSSRTWSLLAALLAGWGVALAAPRDFMVGTFVDDAQYAVLAKALREQGSYRVLNLPGAPVETKYPPAWPAVLAVAWAPSLPDAANLDRLRWVNLLLLGPLAAVVALAGVELLGLAPPLAAALSIAGLAAPTFVKLWAMPMSEPLCLGLVAAGLVLLGRGKPRLATAVLAAAVYVRTLAGPFMVGAVVVTWLRHGRRRALQSAALGAALLLPWGLHLAVSGSAVPPALTGVYGSYGEWYLQSLRADWPTVLLLVPAKNAVLLLQALGEGLAGWPWPPPLVLGVTGAGVAVLLWRARRGGAAVAAGLALYFVVVLAWPFAQAGRFVGGVWPLVLLGVVAGLPGRRSRTAVAVLALAAAGAGFLRGEGVAAHRRASRATAPLLERVRPLIPGGVVVAASNPPLYYLTLGHSTVPNERMRAYRWYRLGFWATAWGLGDDLWEIVRRYRPAYLVVERRGAEGRYAAGSLIRQCPDVLREVWRSAEGEMVYAVRPDGRCAPERSAR